MKTKRSPCKGGCNNSDLSKHHHAWGGCSTDFCGGWSEYHCMKCGWYFTECACGCENGHSKISTKAMRTIHKKMMAKIKQPKENVHDRL